MNRGIMQTNFDGVWCVLVDGEGRPVPMGGTVKDFRGDDAIVNGGQAPHKPGATGFVFTVSGMFYASVFGLEWRPLSRFTPSQARDVSTEVTL